MKRRPERTLFDREPEAVYLIDSSAWFNIDERPDSEEVWKIIFRLIGEERIKVCSEVFNEIRETKVYERLQFREAALKDGLRRSTDLDFLRTLGDITHKHPSMCKARSRKQVADPYVIAHAELDGYVVVADESTKRPNRKIPGACGKRGIRCHSLDRFIADNSTSAAA